MSNELSRIQPTRRSGSESLHADGNSLGPTLLDFWRWSLSDQVYVFALLAHKDKSSIDPLNVRQWRFYVLPSVILDARTRSQHSITLNSLEALAGAAILYGDVQAAVHQAVKVSVAADITCSGYTWNAEGVRSEGSDAIDTEITDYQ